MTFKEDYVWKCKYLKTYLSLESKLRSVIIFEKDLPDNEKYQRLKDIYLKHETDLNDISFKKEKFYFELYGRNWLYKLRAKIINFLL